MTSVGTLVFKRPRRWQGFSSQGWHHFGGVSVTGWYGRCLGSPRLPVHLKPYRAEALPGPVGRGPELGRHQSLMPPALSEAPGSSMLSIRRTTKARALGTCWGRGCPLSSVRTMEWWLLPCALDWALHPPLSICNVRSRLVTLPFLSLHTCAVEVAGLHSYEESVSLYR